MVIQTACILHRPTSTSSVMKTEKIHLCDIELVRATLKRCAAPKIHALIGDTELLSVCLELVGSPDGFTITYGLEKKETSSSWEYVVKVFLSHIQVRDALWECLRRRKEFSKFPSGWPIKVDVGFRDSYGEVTVWAESPEGG